MFAERLRLPWWHWPLPLIGAVLIGAECDIVFPGYLKLVPYLITIALMIAALIWFGRMTVRLTERELIVGEEHIARASLGHVEVLTGTGKRKALGPELDPTAFVLHRGWVRAALRVEVTDADSATPYWLFSVRNAEKLATLLRANQ